MKIIIRVRSIFRVALLLAMVPGLLVGQTTTKPVPTPPITPVGPRLPGTIQPPSIAPSTDEVAPIYGLQGVLIETLDGKIISSQSENVPLNPASAVKLGTALIALKTFGPQHRFSTGFWTTGTFDKGTGQIQGDLYLTGRDPSFHFEHAVMVARQLNGMGIRSVTGNLVVSPGFTMNFHSSAMRSGEMLYDTLDATLRSVEATRAWVYERTTLGDQVSLQTVPSVAVMGDVQIGSVPPAAKLLLTHKSSQLTSVLKVLLCYSNNFMAERIGDSLGGTESVERRLVSELGIAPGEVRLASLSGLGVNRVTPRAMMKIFRGLRTELQKHRLVPADIMPVAGIDPGTLEDRFTGPAWQGSVIAKTGTLVRTDSGASALVGQMRTASGETLLFVILNQQGNVSRFRRNQDYLVMQVQNSRGGPRAFSYKPMALTMRLSDTKSISGSAGNEFEPDLKQPVNAP
jgi:serine-type D-Ala-D-Ala carboxypeptidase/endopeptidase (penicillin-binding protein 4)